MSYNRWDRRVDTNQQDIIDEAKRLGADVEVIGQPVDLLVEVCGLNFLWEVKRPNHHKWTIAQVRFLDRWKGGVATIETLQDVRDFIERVHRTFTCSRDATCSMRLLFPQTHTEKS